MARGKYKGPKRGSGQKNRTQYDDEDEPRAPQPTAQASNVGVMPPSDSDESDDEAAAPAPAGSLNMFAGMGAPGELPPNSSEEDSSDDDDDIQPHGASAVPPPRKKKEEEVDPAQIAKDMERLQLAKEKREKQRLERIAKEGWDRFAPVTETNKPPDGRPADHPDFQG